MSTSYLLSLPRQYQKSFFERLWAKVLQCKASLFLYRLRCLPLLKKLDAVADAIKLHWLSFLELANKVQLSGVWRLYARTWHEFARQRWNIDSSRISQLRTAKPYAIVLNSFGAIPLEGEIRKIKPFLAANNPMLAQVYSLGQAVAKSEGRATTPAIYKRSLEVLETAQETGGVYPVGDKLFFIENEAQAIDAVKATLAEASKIGMDSESIKIKVRAKRLDNGLWDLDFEGSLPLEFSFIAYVKG